MLSRTTNKEDMDGLKTISQQFIFNMWYEFNWGLHNELGVHGALAMEMLHWIQLGWHKYGRSTFFEKLREYSQLAKSINIIASQMGILFQ